MWRRLFMASIQYNQSNFTKGEIDPLLAARFDYDGYGKFVKRARNCLTIPQGPIRQRFGTQFVASLGNLGSPQFVEMATFLYNNNATYVFVFVAGNIYVYLENILCATITSTGYAAEDISDLRFSQVETRLIITNPNFAPAQIVGPTGSPQSITTNLTSDYIILSTPVTAGIIFPITFATSGTLPTTSPQIYAGRTYFSKAVSTVNLQIYSSPEEASDGIGAYDIVSAGSSSTATPLIVFSKSNITFSNYPAYDFGLTSYSGLTFTPTGSLTTIKQVGQSITLDISGGTLPVVNQYVGGVFSSGGGVIRITSNDATHLIGVIVSELPTFFASSVETYIPMVGSLSFLGEVAWSAAKGYPRCSTFFQNRLWLAGTALIPNGVWGSVLNDATDFDDSESFDDNAIGYYPASGNLSYIQSMTSTRSLLVHTSTGSYSTPLTSELPVTPNTISFVEQNKDGVSAFQPIVIDNQVIFVDSSQNNVKNLIWEFSQSAYVLRNISITSSSLIRKPTDIANYSNPLFIDGSYAFITNSDGTLACFQSLYTEEVAGWTLATTSQQLDLEGEYLYQNDFSHVASSLERVWFINKRGKLSNLSGSSLSATITDNVLTTTNAAIVSSSSIDGSDIFYVTFSGSPLPTSVPAITATQYYYIKVVSYAGSNVVTFRVYENYQDAQEDVDGSLAIVVSSAGTTTMTPASLVDNYVLEELDFDTLLDSTISYASNNGTITGLSDFNGQFVQVTADGYIFPPQQVFNGQIVFASGMTWNSVKMGYPFTSEVALLPVNNMLATGSNFYKQKNLRQFYLYYFQTLGATINDYSFPETPIEQVQIGAPAVPQTGIVNVQPLLGWDGLDQEIIIKQKNPLPMTILGYSLSVEIT